MTLRYLLIGSLFLGVAVTPTLLDPFASPAAPRAAAPAVPTDALAALREGRYWHASRILRGYLAAAPDTMPEAILLTAQAEAGWGGWPHVEALLSGRSWLDSLAGGYGWKLLGRSRWELGEFVESERALARYLSVAPAAGDRERGIAEGRRGLAARRAGDDSAAIAAFRRAGELLPQIGDWIEIFIAEAAAERGDTAAVRERLAAVDPRLAREWGWRYRVRAAERADDLDRAALAARDAAGSLSDSRRRAEAWRRLGELRVERGDTARARDALLQAMRTAPGAVAAVDAARTLSELPGLTAETRLRIGRLYLRHGNLRRGRAGLAASLDAGRGSAAERAAIRLELGRAHFRAGEYRRAERLLSELSDDATSDSIAAAALYLVGRAHYRSGRPDAGRATFLNTADRFPGSVPAAEAMFLIADLDHDDGRLETARRFYREAIRSAPAIDKSGLAAMRLAGIAFAAGDYADAVSVYEQYRRRFPNGRRYEQATYWAALAHEAIGDTAAARARLEELYKHAPFSYYGMRAADRIGRRIDDAPLRASPARRADAEAEVAAAMARVDLLRELGADDAVVYEVGRLRRHFLLRDAALYAFAESLNARGYTYTGVRLGWEIHRREGEWNPRLLRIVYPFPYRSVVVAEARERGLDPFLVAGLVRQESMFNADARSPVGARGLMQIMPATGRSLARQAGLGRFREQILERPEVNVHLGTKYLQELFGRFGDRLPAVLAAYNAGPRRVARWREFPEYADPELFAERIPYRETRHYVKAVQQHARLYAMLYGPEVAAADRRAASTAPDDADAAPAGRAGAPAEEAAPASARRLGH